MLFNHRELVLLKLALVTAIFVGLFGTRLMREASAAPQVQESSFDISVADICYPGTGWVWARGSLRPDVAQ